MMPDSMAFDAFDLRKASVALIVHPVVEPHSLLNLFFFMPSLPGCIFKNSIVPVTGQASDLKSIPTQKEKKRKVSEKKAEKAGNHHYMNLLVQE